MTTETTARETAIDHPCTCEAWTKCFATSGVYMDADGALWDGCVRCPCGDLVRYHDASGCGADCFCQEQFSEVEVRDEAADR
jgi:hypothetical protein